MRGAACAARSGVHVSSALLMFTCGSLLAVPAITRQFMATKLYTNEQATGAALAGLVGLSVGHPCALLMRRLTAMWLCVIACVLCTIMQLLLWSALKEPMFYEHKKWLPVLYAFGSGNAMSYMYHTTIAVNLVNNRQHIGTVLGGLHVCMVCASVVFNTVFNDDRLMQWPDASLFLAQLMCAIFATFTGVLVLRPTVAVNNVDSTTATANDNRGVRDSNAVGGTSRSLDATSRSFSRRRRNASLRDSFSDVRALTTTALEYNNDSNDDLEASLQRQPTPVLLAPQSGCLQSPAFYYAFVSVSILLAVSLHLLWSSEALWTIAVGDTLPKRPFLSTEWQSIIMTVIAGVTCLVAGIIIDNQTGALAASNLMKVALTAQLLAVPFVLINPNNAALWPVVMVTSALCAGTCASLGVVMLVEHGMCLRNYNFVWSTLLVCACAFGLVLVSIPFIIALPRASVCAGVACTRTVLVVDYFLIVVAAMLNCMLRDRHT